MKTRKVDVYIEDLNGEVLVDKPNFEVPEQFSDKAAQIIAKLYAAPHENSFLEIVDRVVDKITEWGKKDGYFKGNNGHNDHEPLPEVFSKNLKDILLNQRAAFNSPVWFNLGLDSHSQQASACYILNVEDSIEDILAHTVREGKIFKWGSGAGVNISKVRGSNESLSTGGTSSGPLSFMRIWDKSAGQVRSGGSLRRSAKLIIMNDDHPDIEKFIVCKKEEEEKAKALINEGFSPEEAYATVDFQNTNHSVSISDHFMDTLASENDWDLINRTDKQTYKTVNSKDLFRKICQNALETGDPGVFFYDTINKDNPVPSLGDIESGNPCIEYLSVNNTSCNLASFNLVKYLDENNLFNYDTFYLDIRIMVIAMDIICGNADYPLEEVAKMTKATRALGLGFSNLGAYLMHLGMPYDSDEARKEAASLTESMFTIATHQSIVLAKKLGPFEYYEENKDRIKEIISRKHIPLKTYRVLDDLNRYGIRNSQITLLAPCGSISFLMDCDTTGIEPLFAKKITKKMSDGSVMEIEPKCVAIAKDKWGDVPHLFDTANEISADGHLLMMAAVQKHLSSGISKTVNLPKGSTVEDVEKTFLKAYDLGIKAVTVYVDGAKGMQPISDSSKKVESKKADKVNVPTKELAPVGGRIRLPDTRLAWNHKFNIAGHEGYVTIGVYPNGAPGEVFIRMNKQGSTLSGIMDSFAVSISLAIQYGVPLQKFVDKFKAMKFEPSGITTNEQVRICDSIVDYIFRWIEANFIVKKLSPIDYLEYYDSYDENDIEEVIYKAEQKKIEGEETGDFCAICGGSMIKAGTCTYCTSCGVSSGCS